MWIARIESKPKYSRYGIHHYSWKGKISGISGDVDMNDCMLNYPAVIVKKHFNGN